MELVVILMVELVILGIIRLIEIFELVVIIK